MKPDILKQSCYPIAFFAGILGTSVEIVNVLTILILLDVATGLVKAYRVNGGNSIRSGRLSAGILSKLVVILIPLVIALTGKGIGLDLTALVKGTLSTLILAEAYSNLSNIQMIRSGIEVKEFDVISKLVKSVQKVLLKLLDK